jgi:hypothetical protein
MKFAVYNPNKNKVLTWVTAPHGSLPEGCSFVAEDKVPPGATMEVHVDPVEPVPQEVPMWALKELCLIRKHATDIQNALSNLPEPTKTIAQNRWDNKDTISRNSQIIAAMRLILKWTNEYVDELFIAADLLSKS